MREGQGYAGVDRRGWRISKEISLGDAIALTFAIGSLIVAYSTLNERMSKLEEFRQSQLQRDSQQDEIARQVKGDVVNRLDRIEDKLDRVIEHESPRRRVP